MTYVLEIHAAQALGVPIDQINLPRSGYGIDGDALWTCARFIEIRRSREACQLATHRNDLQPCLQHKPRTEEQKEATLSKTRQRRYARKKAQRKAKSAKRAAAIAAAAPIAAAHFSVAAYALAHGMAAANLRQQLRAAGRRAPYCLADVEQVV